MRFLDFAKPPLEMTDVADDDPATGSNEHAILAPEACG